MPSSRLQSRALREMALIEKLMFDYRTGTSIRRSATRQRIKVARAQYLLAKGFAFERIKK